METTISGEIAKHGAVPSERIMAVVLRSLREWGRRRLFKHFQREPDQKELEISVFW